MIRYGARSGVWIDFIAICYPAMMDGTVGFMVLLSVQCHRCYGTVHDLRGMETVYILRDVWELVGTTSRQLQQVEGRRLGGDKDLEYVFA